MVASLGEWTIWGARGGGEQRRKEKEGGVGMLNSCAEVH